MAYTNLHPPSKSGQHTGHMPVYSRHWLTNCTYVPDSIDCYCSFGDCVVDIILCAYTNTFGYLVSDSRIQCGRSTKYIDYPVNWADPIMHGRTGRILII